MSSLLYALQQQEQEEEEPTSANTAENLGWRGGALAAILLCGVIGCSAPAVVTRYTRVNANNPIFLIGKAFGTGVVIATAYIHIMPEASEQLSEGIPDVEYPLFSLFALIATLLVVLIEQAANDLFERYVTPARNYEQINTNGEDDEEYEHHDDHEHHHHDHGHHHDHDHEHGHTHIPLVGNDVEGKTQIIAYILEFGIAVHSIIIGLALGCQTEVKEIQVLMAALCFHQCFEGFALGTSVVQAKLSLTRNIVMVAIFSLTTPIGIGIGMIITEFQQAESSTLLILQGIFDSVSFGILIYMGLVDMMSEDFAVLRAMKSKPSIRYIVIISMALGSTAMAIIGLWA